MRASNRLAYGVLLVAGLLNSCVPAVVPETTAVDGTVAAGGVPVAGVEVTYTWAYRWADEVVTLKDTTDASGRFAFEGERGLGIVVLFLPAHSLTAIQLSFSAGDSIRTTAGEEYHMGPVLERLQVACDLDRSGSDLCQITGPEYMRDRDRYFWNVDAR